MNYCNSAALDNCKTVLCFSTELDTDCVYHEVSTRTAGAGKRIRSGLMHPYKTKHKLSDLAEKLPIKYVKPILLHCKIQVIARAI